MKVKLLKRARGCVKVYERNKHYTLKVNESGISYNVNLGRTLFWREHYCDMVFKIAKQKYGFRPKKRII